MPDIAMTKRVTTPYAETVEHVKAALAEEGFGVLTEIDVKDTLRKKIDVEFRDYVIIGACNPPLAHRALSADLAVGALLPCNVVVYSDDGGSVVSMFDPEVGMALVDSDALVPIAQEAKARLRRALDRI